MSQSITPIEAKAFSEEVSAIDFSIVIALMNHGGHWQECIRSWAREQDYPRERYEVIVVSNGLRPYEKDVKELLRENDSLVVCDYTHELDVYDYGIKQAQGKFVFLAEAHSIGMPNCLSEMINYLVKTGRPGAMCQSFGAWKSYVGGLQEKVFEEENAIFGTGDHWHRIALRGTAILKSVYLEFGGFPKKYSMFGDRWFDIELFRKNVLLGYAHESIVKHYNVSGYAHLDFSVRLFTFGECEYREDFSDRHCAAYIGPSKPWRERLFFHPVIAQLRFGALKQLIVQRFFFKRKLVKSAISLLPVLIEAGLISIFGVKIALWQARFTTKMWKTATQILHALGNQKLTKSVFQAYFQFKLVDAYRYEYIYNHPAKVTCSARLSFPMEVDLDEHLVNFHSIEQTADGKHYRWSQPISVLNTQLPSGNYVLEVEDAACRPVQFPANVAVFFNQHELKRLPSQADENILRFQISRNQFSKAQFQHLLLISDCFQPSKHGSTDDRKLGIAIAKIEFQSIISEPQGQHEKTEIKTA